MVRELIDVALGNGDADLVVRGGTLVNVFTRELYAADVAIKGQYIVRVGDVSDVIGPATDVIDATGLFLTPGLIDQHIHIHETQLDPVQFAAAVVPRGTTTVCTDFYGETVVGGVRAARLGLDAGATTPLRYLYALPTPAFYQSGDLGHSGHPTMDEMLEMLAWPECVGMDDVFASKVMAKDPDMLKLVQAVRNHGKRIFGHASETEGAPLQAWLMGVGSADDHEAIAGDEAVEKARLGVFIAMREGSGCGNVRAVVKAVTEQGIDPRRFCFCTDLISPQQIQERGHIDGAIREAVRAGLSPVVAVQMATINAAERLGIDEYVGAIGPGKIADILLVNDLADFEVVTVIASGERVAHEGKLTKPLPQHEYPSWTLGTVRIPRELSPGDFRIPVSSNGATRATAEMRVIGAKPNSLITEALHATLPLKNGEVHPDVDRDILKIAAIERVRGTGEIGVGLIHGFGLKDGAIASTYNSQQQNMVVLGANEADMALAANTLARVGGGFTVVRGGKVLATLELPIFGLAARATYDEVANQLRELEARLVDLGCLMPEAFHALGFMALPVDIGTLKISPRGLVDVWQGATVPVQIV